MSRTPAQAAGVPGGGPARGTPEAAAPKAAPASAPATPAGARPQPRPAAGAAPGGPAPAVTAAPAGTTPTSIAAPTGAVVRRTGLQVYLTPRNLKIGIPIAAAVVVLTVLFVWQPWTVNAPRLNEPVAVIAKFAASSSLKRLPFDQQRQYLDLLDEKDEGVMEAYEAGKLTDQEYRRALQLAWYGDHLKKMDKFYSKPPSMRAVFLDSQVEKQHKKKDRNKHEPKPDPKAALSADEIKRDDTTEEQDIATWPADVRQRWTDYRNAYASRKQFWKDYREQQKATREANKGKGKTKGGSTKGEATAKAAPATTAPSGDTSATSGQSTGGSTTGDLRKTEGNEAATPGGTPGVQ